MNYVVVPKYHELGVNKIWNYVRELPELMQYFPDYDGKSLPELQYILDILYTLKPDIVADLIKEARRYRGLEKMITMIRWSEFWLLDDISTLLNVKGRILITFSYWSIDSRGRTPYLLKKIAKPRKKKKKLSIICQITQALFICKVRGKMKWWWELVNKFNCKVKLVSCKSNIFVLTNLSSLQKLILYSRFCSTATLRVICFNFILFLWIILQILSFRITFHLLSLHILFL